MTKKDQIISDAFSLMREGRRSEGVELLYSKCFPKMYGIAFSLLKNEQDSRDAVHNVIARLLTMDEGNLPSVNELGWLYSVIKNESLNLLKSNRQSLELDESIKIGDDEDGEIKAIADMDSYQGMIKTLDTARAEIVTLKVLGGFTHKEIAELLGKPMGTVQWLYATAIIKLKKSVVTLFILSVLSSAGLVGRLISSSGTDTPPDRPGVMPDIPDDIPGATPEPDIPVPPSDIFVDYWIIILGVLVVLFVGALIWMLLRKPKFLRKPKK